MRSSSEIKQIFMDLAEQDNRIRAILLQGSRADKNITPDALQDFDILLIVDNMESFLSNHEWTSLFGNRIIRQLPDEMDTGPATDKKLSFQYLMLFTDGNRIDLTLFPKERMNLFKPDSLSFTWLDKDGLFSRIESPSDKDYLIRPPTEKEFADSCNEFWWVSPYISKGLIRDEIPYAKAMMEGPVRQMFMRMISWYIGTETGFTVSFGKEGKFMKNHLSKDVYNRILETYPDYESENIWNALCLMTELFSHYSKHVADKLLFKQNRQESENVVKYLRQQYNRRNRT